MPHLGGGGGGRATVALFVNVSSNMAFQSQDLSKRSEVIMGTREAELLLCTGRFVAVFVRLLNSPGIYN